VLFSKKEKKGVSCLARIWYTDRKRREERHLKDFPMFVTEYGAASLILREIPYRGIAYIRIQDTQEPEKLVEECVSFCRMSGADKIYAFGDPWLERLPLHAAVWEMRGIVPLRQELTKALWPVTQENAARFRELYNKRMFGVDNAGTLEQKDEKHLAEESGAYFVHDSRSLLGLGIVKEDRLEAIVSLKPGAGEAVLHTLATLNPGEPLTLEVASTNARAIRLYEKNGFLKTRELSRWYEL